MLYVPHPITLESKVSMLQYDDRATLRGAESECRKRSSNSPLKVSELMKAGRFFDAGDRFRQWLTQSGRMAALREIYECEIDKQRTRSEQIERFKQLLELGHLNAIDPTGVYFGGYQIVALDYLKWAQAQSGNPIESAQR